MIIGRGNVVLVFLCSSHASPKTALGENPVFYGDNFASKCLGYDMNIR
jgi:hypothetical protein